MSKSLITAYNPALENSTHIDIKFVDKMRWIYELNALQPERNIKIVNFDPD